MNEQRDFFISFNSKDRVWADWITFHLKRKGYSMYYQFDDFPAGSDFMKEMNNSMLNSKFTLAIWTRNYFDSQFASLEGMVALKHSLESNGTRLIPVQVEECTIDPLFSTRVYINIANIKSKYEAQKLLLSQIEAVFTQNKKGYTKKVPKFPPEIRQAAPVILNKTVTNFVLSEPLKVLIAGSKKSSELDLETSFTNLQKGIKKFIDIGSIKFIKKLNLNTFNMFEILNSIQPHIFHFNGKQIGGDILITDERNNVTTISDMALAGYLSSFGNKLKVAIIDTCHSYDCAKSISEVVDFAIGVKGLIYEVDADKFYKTFYNAICSGHSLKDAVGQATASLKFDHVPVKSIPVLLSKTTLDASKTFFVQ
jgi:hypothetical protein